MSDTNLPQRIERACSHSIGVTQLAQEMIDRTAESGWTETAQWKKPVEEALAGSAAWESAVTAGGLRLPWDDMVAVLGELNMAFVPQPLVRRGAESAEVRDRALRLRAAAGAFRSAAYAADWTGWEDA